MKILLVDDDPMSRKSLAVFLRSFLEHEVVEAEDGKKAWELYQENIFPLVITDIRMPLLDGISLLQKIKEDGSKETDVVMITGFGEMKTAISALRNGAFDYLQKPVNIDELASIVERSEERQALLHENESLKDKVKSQESSIGKAKSLLSQYQKAYREIFGLGEIGIFSSSMKQVVTLVESYQPHRETPVLIQGETGTGKEVVARMIHCEQDENLRPFITVNCSAISPNLFESELFGYEAGAFTGAQQSGQPGKLELAQGGTLFLDEIGDLPLEMQPKLLRTIQMRELYRVGSKDLIKLDVRFVCATNRNLEEMIKNGEFRQDLFYRLNTGQIIIPPLRERKDDILPLASMFLNQFARQKKKKFRQISKEAEIVLSSYNWPGNIRELQNTIERVVLLYDSPELLPQHLPYFSIDINKHNDVYNRIIVDLPDNHFDYLTLEKEIINQILLRFNGNKQKTADYLGITRNRLNRKLKS